MALFILLGCRFLSGINGQGDEFTALDSVDLLMTQDIGSSEGPIRRLLASALAKGDVALTVELYNRLALLNGYQQEMDSTGYYHQLAYDAAYATGREPLVDTVRIAMRNYLLYTGDYRRVVDTLMQALPGFEARRDTYNLVSVYYTIGAAYTELGFHDEALEYAANGLRLANAIGFYGAITRAAINYSYLLLRVSLADSALVVINQAVTAADRIGGSQYRAAAYGQRAVIHTELGRFEAALRDYQLVRQFEGGLPSAAYLTNVGSLYQDLNMPDSARYYLRQALAITDGTEQDMVTAKATQALITAHLTGSDLDTAEYYLDRWLTLYEASLAEENRLAVLDLREQYEADLREAKIGEQEALLQRRTYQLIGLGLLAAFALLAGFVYSRLNRQLRQRNEENRVLLEQKQSLVEEVHHRVRNNLQTVSSLLNLRAFQLGSEGPATEALTESRRRIEAIGLIHQQLYGGNHAVQVNMRDYLTELCELILDTAHAQDRIELYLDLADVDLDVKTAEPLGLIANELLTNSLKHGFPAGRPGTIEVQLNRVDGDLQLVVADDGVGLDGAGQATGSGFGTQLIEDLASRINGQVGRSFQPGYLVTVRFAPTK